MKKCPNLSLKDGNPHLHTPPPHKDKKAKIDPLSDILQHLIQ